MSDQPANRFKIKSYHIPGILLCAGLLAGFFAGKYYFQITTNSNSVVAVRSGQNKFTNPLLECDQADGSFVELKSFKSDVQSAIQETESDQSVSQVSIYFRDLNNGIWFDIEGNASFSPASLLKVPLAIAYYKLSETSDPGILQKIIPYNGPDPRWPKITQTILPDHALQAGQSYTNEQLIEHMLSYSDNQAYYLLFTNINLSDLLRVYADFNMQLNGPGSDDDSIVTVQGYSKFFRILFNASYLSETDSEKLLSILANAEFNDGLVSGVPKNLTVSHKFSEREVSDNSQVQLNDCGIIYYPKHPYLLCVMTRGSDLTKEAAAISKVSSVVYNKVDEQVNTNQ